MAKWQLIQLACSFYLIVSGPIIADANRIQQESKGKLDLSEGAENEGLSASHHPWCNPLSGQTTKTYHFDIEYTEKKCEDGACAAMELVREYGKPVLNIHPGKQWLIQREENGTIDWGLYSPGPENSEKRTINLYDVELVKFLDADDDEPDQLEITIESTGHGHEKKKDVFMLQGGLWYNEYLVNKGMDDINRDDFKDIEKDAARATHAATGANKGKWIGGVGGVLGVGGMYTAATVLGTAVQTQALIGAAVCGIIGGSVAGLVTGGIFGVAVSLGLAISGYRQVRGYKIVPASRKIYEKLRCMEQFKTCKGDKNGNTLVKHGSKCPRR